MELFWQIIVLLGSICGILSFVLLLAVGVYVVKLRDDFMQFFRELIEVISAVSNESDEVVQPKKKTWDEKYEESLAEFEEFRRREGGGLVDIDERSNNYAKPPAPKPEDGLTTNE